MDDPNSSFGVKVWSFLEGPFAQLGYAIVLIGIGIYLTSNLFMVLAFGVFLSAAYRARLFVHPTRKQRIISYVTIPVIIALVLAACWYGALKIKEWSDRKSSPAAPTSDLRIENELLVPFRSNETIKFSVTVFNDSQYIIKYRDVSEVAVIYSGIPNQAALENKERELWQTLKAEVSRVKKLGHSDEDFYNRQFPPKVSTNVTIAGNKLNAKEVNDLKDANGYVTIFFMAIYSYRDATGAHALEHCSYTQGRGALFRCEIGHNGPADG